MKSSNRAFVGAVVIAVALAIAVGLFLAGSPAEARKGRLDDRRIEDLLGLSFAIEEYARQQGRLPPSLGDLAQGPGRGLDSTDPATRQVYGYRTTDPSRYELCAIFEQASDRDANGGRWSGNREWVHAASRQCFRRELREKSY